MIEDLDRCDPIKAAELLKAINLLIPDASSADPLSNSRLDSKEVDKLIFIIAIDRAKVAAGLAATNKKLARYISDPNMPASQIPSTSETLAYWYEYLEKFVQLPFRLPRVDDGGVRNYVRYLVNASSVITDSSDKARVHENEETEDVTDADGPFRRR